MLMGERRLISLEQWSAWSAHYNALPYVMEHRISKSRIGSWKRVFREAGEPFVILESGKMGRFTFLATEPVEWVQGGMNGGMRVCAEMKKVTPMAGDPFTVLRCWMSEFRAPKLEGLPKLLGGILGYVSYDVVRAIEKLPEMAAADSPLPDYFFLRADRLWIIDHEEGILYCAVYVFREEDELWDPTEIAERYEAARAKASAMKRRWDEWMGEEEGAETARESLAIEIERIPGLRLSMSKQEYIHAVKRVQEYIASGDVFQVNLSLRQSKPLHAPTEAVYEALRSINPSPYMAFLRLPGGGRIVSGSPELLVSLADGRVSTRPIAGTRPRGNDAVEDGDYRQELLLSEKERAEHIMLVDLERNDLGKISEYGTVKVKELMTVEHYSHVMHIVSEVEGRLAVGKDALDCLAAVFPGGTITGAPKIRTMEIIEELEPVRRGVYTGSIGWIDYSGNMEFNITIRTLVYADGLAHVQSGAGIVIDSDPEKEFTESLNKAKALWKAVEISERMSRRIEPSGAEQS